MNNFLKSFTHLHLHTDYSLLDGLGSPSEKVARAKELGMNALAITDHNHLGGVLDFQEACKKNGIKPLLGVELYWTWDTAVLSLQKEERDKIAIDAAINNGIEIPKKATKKIINELISPYQYDTKSYHIILIAKNQIGWNNLVKLQSMASEKCTFNGFFHCDNNMLREYSEGLICSTACIGSVVASKLSKDEDDIAKEILEEWISIFGKENLFLEMQGLDWDKQYKVNKKLITLSKQYNLRLTATNDVHYTLKEDHDIHDTLLCIGTGKLKSETNRMKYDHEFWIKNYDEMIESFKRCDDSEEYVNEVITALDNTNLVADMIDENIMLKSPTPLFTKVDIPNNLNADNFLIEKSWIELYKYLKRNPSFDRLEYEARLKWELYVIVKKGYTPYMLTVEDFVKWANENGCPTGPGRGSAAGSLVLFLLGITQVIDPIQNGLLFSRFLTMDRTALPDIDVDFCYYGRASVIQYLKDKYGEDCVSHIGTYTTLGVKNGLKDVARVLEIPFTDANAITKKITELTDEAVDVDFKMLDNLKESSPSKYEEFKKLEATYSELFATARKMEGSARNYGVHASGVLVTPTPINDTFPTRYDKSEGVRTTLYTGPQVEDCNGVKYDLLGLRTVSVIDLSRKSIDDSLTWTDLYKMININDSNMFDLIRNKQTDAMFQIESNLFKQIVSEMKASAFDDIVVATALGRPGPLKAGMVKKYNDRKNGLEETVYPLHNIEEIVGDTYGTIAYQEQVMAISKKVAGFDDNQADSYLRKALAKKKVSVMNLCKRWFIYGKINEKAPEGYDNDNVDSVMYDPDNRYGAPILGGINNGYDKKDLELFWNDMEGYASYLFNKSHAACYSYITIMTAYLKRYYPVEFYSAVLSVTADEGKKANYLKIAYDSGITIDLPDINLSAAGFTPVVEKNKILYGIGCIKGIGEAAVKELIKNAPYISLNDMIERLPKKVFNKKIAEALIKSGALDSFNSNRYELLNEFYTIRKDKIDLYDFALYKDDENICIEMEKSTLGASITHRPWWDAIAPGEKVAVTAKVNNVRELIDKNGNMMAFVDVEINNCIVKSVVFASTYCKNADKFDMTFEQPVVTLKGKKDDSGSLIVSSVK